MDDKAKIIISILSTLLILTNGTQFLLNETGKTLRCTTGWVFQETGTHEGQYLCKTNTAERYVYCSKTWDSTNTFNYYCSEATPVFIVKEETTPTGGNEGIKYSCPPGGLPCIKINQ